LRAYSTKNQIWQCFKTCFVDFRKELGRGEGFTWIVNMSVPL
jgi:hypothetical protein